MPTYTVWAEPNVIDRTIRKDIAHSFTEIHHEVARAPRYFVQVVFAALDDESIYLAGRPAGEGHIWVRADIRAGRTDEQKNELIERILTELSALTGVSPEHIWVYISDIPGPSVAEFGRVLPHPGGEDAWFASLPEDLKAQLREQA